MYKTKTKTDTSDLPQPPTPPKKNDEFAKTEAADKRHANFFHR